MMRGPKVPASFDAGILRLTTVLDGLKGRSVGRESGMQCRRLARLDSAFGPGIHSRHTGEYFTVLTNALANPNDKESPL
jgi:hypothetical protein